METSKILGVGIRCTKPEFIENYERKLNDLGFRLSNCSTNDGSLVYPTLFVHIADKEMYFVSNNGPDTYNFPTVESTDEFFSILEQVLNSDTENVSGSTTGCPNAVEFPYQLTEEQVTNLFRVAPEESRSEMLSDFKWGRMALLGEPVIITESQYLSFRTNWKSDSQQNMLTEMFGPAPWTIKDAKNGDIVLVSNNGKYWDVAVATGDGAIYDPIGRPSPKPGAVITSSRRIRQYTPENFELALSGKLK